jgi:hypothetical protein
MERVRTEKVEAPAPTPGRRPLYGETMRQTGIRLPREMIAWLKARPEGVSEYLRALIAREMAAEKQQ